MKNMPYNVMRHRDWDHAPRDPFSIGAAIAASLGVTSTVGVFLITAATFIGITAVTSWAISALTPKPRFGSLGSQGILVNSREAAAPHHFVYGEIRKGGTITYLETTGATNEFLHMIVALAGHPVHEIGDIFINDEIVTIDNSGNVTDAFLDPSNNPTIRIQKFDGTQTNAPATLLNESELTGADELTSAFVGSGIAYLYIRMKYDQSAYPNGIPLFTAVVKGKRVFDPRTSTTGWSDNAALCIRDYLTSAYGLLDTNIDNTVFSAAANISDELVTLSGLGTVKRYTLNGVVTADTAHGDVLSQMVTSCAGTLFWGAGKWKLTVGDYVAPTKTLTLNDLRGAISVQTRNNLRDQFNIVQGTFINKDERWITEDYPAIVGTAFIAEDNNIPQPLDLELPFTTDSATAQRLAKLTLFRGREQATIFAEFGMNAFDVEVGEIIELDISRYGWSSKEFEVIGWQLKANEDAGDLRVALTLRETSQAAFDWNAEETDIIGNNTNLPNSVGGLTINNLVASGGGRTQGDGTFINSAILSWDRASNVFVTHYEVEWRPLSDSVFDATTTEQNGIEISPVIDGIEYLFRVRAVTVSGVKGPYATVQFTGGGDVTAPGLPTDITATGHFEYIAIRWTNPADADLNYVEVWEADSNNSALATRVGISGGNSFIRTNLGLSVTKFYFLKSVDYSGNASAFTASVTATTTFLDDADFANGIYSLFTSQGLYAIKDVTSLPPAGAFVGEKVFNRTDGKLYQWTGSAWVLVIADVAAGSITETKIANDAITTPKIAAGAVTANEIAGNTITGNKIVANTITGGLLATSGIITNSAQIDNAVVTNAKIANLAVDTIKIANNAVTNSLADEDTLTVPADSVWRSLSSVTLTTASGNPIVVQVAGTAVFAVAGMGDPAILELRVLRNGSVIRTFSRLDTADGITKTIPSVALSTTSTSSSTTIATEVRNIASTATNVTPTLVLIATEFKK
jgi:hypothetical protein